MLKHVLIQPRVVTSSIILFILLFQCYAIIMWMHCRPTRKKAQALAWLMMRSRQVPFRGVRVNVHMPHVAMQRHKKKQRFRCVCVCALLGSFFGLETEAKLYKAKA